MKNLPPQNIEVEQDILGTFIIENATIPEAVSEGLLDGDFYKEAHRRLYRAILDLYGKNEPIDLRTLCDYLRKSGELEAVGGNTYIASLAESIPTTANIKPHVRIVRERAQLRELKKTSRRVEESDDFNEALSIIQSGVSQVTDSGVLSLVSMRETAPMLLRQIEDRISKPDQLSGLSCGLKEIDALFDGFQPGDFIIPAGRAGMGKSAFALCLAGHVAQTVPIGFFSLEMSAIASSMRMLAAISKTPAWRLRKGLLEKDGLSAIYQGIGRLADLQIYFADRKSRTLRRIEQGICSMVTSQKVGLVIVDYLQLISAEGKSQNREREISEISGTLKSLAMQFNIPIIALSQLNRDLERRDNKRPILADLRDSGSLEQDADIVMLLYRDDYYNPRSPERGIVEINIAKGRNTGTGTIKLRWDAERQTFSDL